MERLQLRYLEHPLVRSCGIGRRLAGPRGVVPWFEPDLAHAVDRVGAALPVHGGGEVSISFRLVEEEDASWSPDHADPGCWRTVGRGEACGRPSDPTSPTGLCDRHSRELREAPADG